MSTNEQVCVNNIEMSSNYRIKLASKIIKKNMKITLLPIHQFLLLTAAANRQ